MTLESGTEGAFRFVTCLRSHFGDRGARPFQFIRSKCHSPVRQITHRGLPDSPLECLGKRSAGHPCGARQLLQTPCAGGCFMDRRQSRRLLNWTPSHATLLEDMESGDLLDEASGVLEIAVHRGFERPFLEFFARVDRSDDAACGSAMRAAERVVVETASPATSATSPSRCWPARPSRTRRPACAN